MAKKDTENIDMEVVAEQELSRLARQYRIMEGDRFAYSGETTGKLKRQRKMINILRREQINIIADLDIATSYGKKKEDIQVNQYLDALIREYECLENSTKTQKCHLAELEFQIKKVEKEVAEIKTKATTELQAQQRIIAGQKCVATLENKLDTFMKKFNLNVAENFKLRNEIDHLLKERAHFNLLWDRLINSLNQGKKFMLDLIEQATLAYDQREEWCNKLQALRNRGNQDLILHTTEMRTLQRKLDHDKKLHDFLGIKGQKRILSDLEAREEKKRQQAREKMEQQLQDYKDMLNKIQRFCGERDMEKLAIKFVKQEEENFALFNYANELNHESENLSYTIAELRKNIDYQRDLNEKRAQQQADNLAKLEEDLAKETAEADATERQIEDFEQYLIELFMPIEEIFSMIGCVEDSLLELLGDFEEVNEFNVILYLGLIEVRTYEMVQQLYSKEKLRAEVERAKRVKVPTKGVIIPDAKSRYHQNAPSVLVPNQPCPLCVEQEQVSDVIDTLQFAHPQAMVEEKLAIRLELPHALDRLHNVSACHLPQSRKIIQQRYQ